MAFFWRLLRRTVVFYLTRPPSIELHIYIIQMREHLKKLKDDLNTILKRVLKTNIAQNQLTFDQYKIDIIQGFNKYTQSIAKLYPLARSEIKRQFHIHPSTHPTSP
jgi:hypothetical protein